MDPQEEEGIFPLLISGNFRLVDQCPLSVKKADVNANKATKLKDSPPLRTKWRAAYASSLLPQFRSALLFSGKRQMHRTLPIELTQNRAKSMWSSSELSATMNPAANG